MVRVFTSAANAETVKTLLPEAILDVYEEDEDFSSKLEKAFGWSTQAVIGPGIGTSSIAKKLVRTVLKSYDKSLVMDADALNIIAEDKKLRNLAANYAIEGKRLILTPHLAEFSRLLGKDTKECREKILEYPGMLASELHCTVVCKDARTIIADYNESKIYINVSGNDGMATAGSGDVLSGIMGTFVSEKQSSFEAACLSCYLHGLCGDAAAKRLGKRFMAASDITAELANILD
jgi:NAD(P)H-hydrate epimerase